MENDQSQPLQETFLIISEEPEIRVMGIIMEAMRRHLIPQTNGVILDDEMEPARRVARYIASRVGVKCE